MNKKNFFLFLFSLSLGLFSTDTVCTANNFFSNTEMQILMAPYFLPLDHPIKKSLDRIFSKSRVVSDIKSLKNAGFTLIYSRPDKLITVARHPEMPGFVFKMYLDSEKRLGCHGPRWERLLKRCIGAEKIRALIRKKNIRHFTVPDKWLYLLPSEPPADAPQALPVILVATDMELESKELCAAAWKNRITFHCLDELYAILKKGYGTTALIKNVPYTKRGTFTFIDTEYPERILALEKIKFYLSKDMQNYWDYLIY